MRLYTFECGGARHLGAECRSQLVHLPLACEAARRAGVIKEQVELPDNMLDFLRLGQRGMTIARQTLQFMSRRPALPVGIQASYLFEQVTIRAPIPRPPKILCSGINYRGHMLENPGATMPEEPFFFSKLPSAVIGPGEGIVHPGMTEQLDYEVEFAVIIGEKMKAVPAKMAMEHVAGYTILHDVSARDVQFKNNQITLGKNFDTFCPLGPCIVTTDELTTPDKVALRSYLNGTLMQDGNTADWVFPLPLLLSRLSAIMTLEPGDVVSTGTPAGVGVFRKPPVFLKPGDTVRLEIEGIGVLENPVVAEAA